MPPALLGGIPDGVGAADHADLGGRHETAQLADGHDQAALIVADDLALIRVVGFVQLLNQLPVALLARPGEGQDDVAVGVFRGHDIDLDVLADLEFSALIGGDLFQFAAREHAFRLGADAHEDFVLPDGRDGPCPDFSLTRKVQAEPPFQKFFHRRVVLIGRVLNGRFLCGRLVFDFFVLVGYRLNHLPGAGFVLFHKLAYSDSWIRYLAYYKGVRAS